MGVLGTWNGHGLGLLRYVPWRMLGAGLVRTGWIMRPGCVPGAVSVSLSCDDP